jgi:hypothetical protein
MEVDDTRRLAAWARPECATKQKVIEWTLPLLRLYNIDAFHFDQAFGEQGSLPRECLRREIRVGERGSRHLIAGATVRLLLECYAMHYQPAVDQSLLGKRSAAPPLPDYVHHLA